MVFARFRNRIEVIRERDQIIAEMQAGLYTVSQTMERLTAHAKPGGRERDHRFSCRNGYAKCRCPYLFDLKAYVPLKTEPTQETLEDFA